MTTGNESVAARLRRDGYVVVRGVLDVETVIEPALAELAAVVDPTESRSFTDQILERWQTGTPPPSQQFDISLPQTGIVRSTPFNTGPAMLQVLTYPNLLDVVETIVGPEIFSNPVQHVRVKVPESLVASNEQNSLVSHVPWHQDLGVIDPEADNSQILTVWIPLTTSTLDNGCLQVIPGSHRAGELFAHCPGHTGGVGIPESYLPDGHPVPLPVEPGDAILMTQTTVHSSRPNITDSDVRVSLDLRFQAVGEPTGRPWFAEAGFIARSRRDPSTELRNADTWHAQWSNARDRLSDRETPRFNRWSSDAPACA